MIQVSKNDIKKIFVQVRSRGDALYHSNSVQMNSNIQENFDPLLYILQWSKLLDIEIHAWFNTYLIWSAPYKPQNKSHLYYTSPEWFAVDYNGKSDINIKFNNIQSPNWEGLYLSPNHPDVNEYLYSLIKEILERYTELDGIHFDYIRFQDEYYGFNKLGIEKFESEYKFNPKDIYRGVFNEKFGWSIADKDSIENLWISYNSDNITNLVSAVKNHIATNNLNVQLSAAVKSNLVESKNRWYQDWGRWIREDILDFVVVMNYTVENDSFIDRINIINENLILENLDEKIIMGISIYNQDESSIADKIMLIDSFGYDKICFFSYNTIKKQNNILDSIKLSYNDKNRILGE